MTGLNVVSCKNSTWCMFFFSSRRRHTRYWRDWSSDVCSSDLVDVPGGTVASARLWLRAAVHAGPATSRIVDPSSVVNGSTSLRFATCTSRTLDSTRPGRLAQLARAPALQAGGHWFESSTAHLPLQRIRVGRLVCT